MSTDHPSSSTMGISLAEAKPTSSSANVHSSSSTSGTPTGAVSSKQNTEVEMATSSLCCIPINAATAATLAAPETKNLALQLVNEIQKDIDQVPISYGYLKDYRTRVTKQREEASKMIEKKIEEPLEKKIEEVSKTVKTLANSLSPGGGRPAEGPIETDVQEDIIELKKNVKNMRLQILSELKPLISTSKSHPRRYYRTDDSTHERRKSKKLDKEVPNLYKNETLARNSDFKNFKELYDGLGDERKLCLLCFSVFPENKIIKKRFMFYWWIAEGFVAPVEGREQTAEGLANEVFTELMAKRFIEPFSEKRTLAGWVNKCQMNPFVRAALITVARRAKFFDFDAEGNLYPKKDLGGKPIRDFFSCLMCLLAGEETLTESVAGIENVHIEQKLTESVARMEKVHMLFNVDETVLNFEKPELFSSMKNINLLCLGRWQTSQTHHIEVEDTKFLEGLKNMKYLKFLSLQGISLIKDLPTSVSNLTSLTILDIRACPNLEKIPGEIGLLKSLTHLDMSECYLLVNMPKEISMLKELEVLKGFVVGELEGKDQKDSCTLVNLVGLTKLRKLSIFSGRKSFPSDADLSNLNQLKKLLTLSIEWGRDVQEKSAALEAAKQNSGGAATQNAANGFNNRESDSGDSDADSRPTPSTTKRCNCLTPAVPANCFGLCPKSKIDTDACPQGAILPELPTQLEKLDLQCFPLLDAPKWLMDKKLNKLKKLYIRGGMLRDLGQYGLQEKKEWTIKILRLKFLNNLDMDWRELMRLFPELIYLEKVRCPKLTFFPCDEQGVWMKKLAKSK